jgi:hypothetical protein
MSLHVLAAQNHISNPSSSWPIWMVQHYIAPLEFYKIHLDLSHKTLAKSAKHVQATDGERIDSEVSREHIQPNP